MALDKEKRRDNQLCRSLSHSFKTGERIQGLRSALRDRHLPPASLLKNVADRPHVVQEAGRFGFRAAMRGRRTIGP